MADSTTPIPQMTAGDQGKEVTFNSAMDAASPSMLYGRNMLTTTGLTWGYLGGRYNSTAIANGTVSLTASNTNYIVAARSNGAVSVSTATTNWNDTANYMRLYQVVTGTSTATSYHDHRGALTASQIGAETAITAGTTAQYYRGDKTWRDFATDVRAAVLTGLSTAAGTVVTATHTVLEAIGFLQKQVSDNTAAVALKANANNAALTGTTTAETIAASGNVGVGVVPSAWAAAWKALDLPSSALAGASGSTRLYHNAYTGAVDTYKADGAAAMLALAGNVYTFYTAPSGTVGDPITWTQDMTLDASGNLLVGVASGACHLFKKTVTENAGLPVFGANSQSGATFWLWGVSGSSWNAANTAMQVGSDTVTSRSINAAGTINASGADYAEYMRKSATCGNIAKGAIVGVNTDGELTDKWVESVSFLIKSTNPSYVGGDVWGSEESLGLSRPVEPQRIADVTEQQLVSETVPATEEAPAVEAVYETIVTTPGDTDAEWVAKQTAYAEAKATFESALEAARQKVDRIAYSGQVPVNVQGAQPGQYVVPVQDGDGIGGALVDDADITFEQYRKAVGIVQNILPDGRANVRVKVC